VPDTPDWVVTRLQRRFASPPDTTRTATTFGRALAPRYGSDLLTLTLRSLCSRATPFVAPPGLQKVVHTLPGVVPSRLSCPFRALIANEGLLARLARRAMTAVLVRGSNLDRHAVTAFPPTVETSVGFSLGQPMAFTMVVSAVSNRRQPQASDVAMSGVVAATPSDPVNVCPAASLGADNLAAAYPYDRRGGEPGAPTAPDCSPVARSYLGVTRACVSAYDLVNSVRLPA
jgi:hypothetical protein